MSDPTPRHSIKDLVSGFAGPRPKPDEQVAWSEAAIGGGDEVNLIYEPGPPEYSVLEFALDGDWVVSKHTGRALLTILQERLRQESLGWTTQHDVGEGGIDHMGMLLGRYLTKVSVEIARLRNNRDGPKEALADRLAQLGALCIATLELLDEGRRQA